jgi:serine/threonine-protein kinase
MLEIGSLVGEYRIEQLVGQGGMGQVYGAIHPVIGKRAAIKVLRGELCADAEAIERFVLEARAVNQIGHPNIVDVFAFGSLPDGRQYMVMEPPDSVASSPYGANVRVHSPAPRVT